MTTGNPRNLVLFFASGAQTAPHRATIAVLIHPRSASWRSPPALAFLPLTRGPSPCPTPRPRQTPQQRQSPSQPTPVTYPPSRREPLAASPVNTDTGAPASQSNRYGVPVALGRTKIGRRQQAPERNSAADPEEAQPDQELESYLAALAPEEDVHTTGSGRGFGASEVHQLRLPLMANERLKEIAAQQGLSPAALAKNWIMQHLSMDPEPNPAPNGAPQNGATNSPGSNGPFPGPPPNDAMDDGLPPHGESFPPNGAAAAGPGYPAPIPPDARNPAPPPAPGGPAPGGQGFAWPQQEPPPATPPRYGAPQWSQLSEETDSEITVPGGSYY